MNQVITVEKSDMFSKSLEKRNISHEDFRILKEVVYPSAQSDKTVLMVVDYCKARKLDPFKKSVEIVPIWNKTQNKMVDTIWGSINELRVTAFRTGHYAGMDEPKFGPEKTEEFQDGAENFKVTYPEYCLITVYRVVNGQKVTFANPVYWKECFASKKNGAPNHMWKKRPRGQLIKCAEAASLRMAFPEEMGGDYIAEEAFLEASINTGSNTQEKEVNKDLVAAIKQIGD